MARKKLEIEVSFKTSKAKKKLKEVDKSIEDLGKSTNKTAKGLNRMRISTASLRRVMGAIRNNLLLVSFAMAMFAKTIGRTVEAYKKQFIAEHKLIAGLRNVKSATDEGAQALIDYAAALQKTTTFGDEQILNGMAMLSTFQLNETQIAAITPRMLDMAAATTDLAITGGDLSQIALQLGTAFTGYASALTRSGVKIDKVGLKMAQAKGSFEEFNFILGELDKNFKGIAETLAKGPLGQMIQMQRQIGDTAEEIGRAALPFQTFFTKLTLYMATSLSEAVVWWEALFKAREDKIKNANKALLKYRRGFKEANDEILNTLRVMKSAAEKREEITNAQEIAYLEKKNALMENGLTIDEQLQLLRLQNVQLNSLEKEGIISKQELTKRTLELKGREIALENQKKVITEQGLESSFKSIAMSADYEEASRALANQLVVEGVFAAVKGALEEVPFPFNLAVAAAAGLAANALFNSIFPAKKAALGADFVTDRPQIIMVGDNPGNRERVQVTPLSSPNIEGPGPNIVVNIMGGIVQDDYIRNELLPAIKRAEFLA